MKVGRLQNQIKMKKLLNTLLMICLATVILAQTNENISFEKTPPNRPPAIFASSMPPCLIGVAQQYGTSLGISTETLKQAEEFISEAHLRVHGFKKKVKDLELDLMKVSMEERYKDYEKLLRKLSDVKIEASLFHENLVKRARKTFKEEDVQKLDDLIFSNHEVFLASFKLY